MTVLPTVVSDVAALDPALGARLRDDLSRLTDAAGAVAWAHQRIPQLIDASAGGAASLLGAVVDAARDLTGVPTAWALAWSGDPEAGTTSFRALAGDRDGLGAAGFAAPAEISRSIVGQVLRDGRPTWSDDARSDARFQASESVHLFALRSVGCIPVGKRGVLYMLHPTEAGAFTPTARVQITALCGLAGSFLDAQGLSDELDPYAAAEERRRRRRARSRRVPGLVGDAPPMHELFAAIHAFAPMPWPALVLGETGTGKEAVARALHSTSPRSSAPFVPVNCAAIPEQLAESMLFGHVKGAFTGADRPAEGLVAGVRGGTLFLDEVGELPASVQPKLLRLLQEGTYERVGSSRSERFSGRIVAATHRALDRGEGREGFRDDLFHRLGACILRVPPLRDRREDIPDIARFLFARALKEAGKPDALMLDEAALASLQRVAWPGNVREMENLLRGSIARALASRRSVVDVQALGFGTFGESVAVGHDVDLAEFTAELEALEEELPDASTIEASSEPAPVVLSGDLKADTDAFQRGQVREALRLADGNRTDAARRLGVSRQWLHRLLAKWGGEP
ncbi:MAG: sigma-54-dependent Fis family transcriptional regulator [Deltaproteobacteria bacterium]|nr:sigma-54-dependent Fis family transcriptional regulator [Deltaproteobacteria bacterium]